MGVESTLPVKVQREHTCAYCAAVFRYPMTRTVVGDGWTMRASEEAADRNVELVLRTAVDPHPCPTCGAYQPEMVRHLSERAFGLTFKLAHVCILAIGMVVQLGYFSYHLGAWLATACAAIALNAYVRAARVRPNANLRANLEKAAAETADNRLVIVKPGRPSSLAPAGEPMTGLRKVVLAILFLALIGVAAAEWTRLARGWPLNPRWEPAVVGPGDTSTYYVDGAIRSINGDWGGTGAVSVWNSAELGTEASLPVTTDRVSWGHVIHSKDRRTHERTTPCVRATIPSSPELAGRSLTLVIDLAITYPVVEGDGYVTRERAYHETTELRLAAPGASDLYLRLWWIGMAGSTGLFVVIGILRPGNSVLRASASRVVPLDP